MHLALRMREKLNGAIAYQVRILADAIAQRMRLSREISSQETLKLDLARSELVLLSIEPRGSADSLEQRF